MKKTARFSTWFSSFCHNSQCIVLLPNPYLKFQSCVHLNISPRPSPIYKEKSKSEEKTFFFKIPCLRVVSCVFLQMERINTQVTMSLINTRCTQRVYSVWCFIMDTAGPMPTHTELKHSLTATIPLTFVTFLTFVSLWGIHLLQLQQQAHQYVCVNTCLYLRVC